MAEIIMNAYLPHNRPKTPLDIYRFKPSANALINASYGNKKQAVKEFVDWIKDWLDGCQITFYNGVEEAIWDSDEVQQEIDRIFKEHYGEDKL